MTTITNEQVQTVGLGSPCDACGSSPRVLFRREEDNSEFFFCGHHCNENESILFNLGYSIVTDYRLEEHKFTKISNPDGGLTKV